jgi:hypothetical protein
MSSQPRDDIVQLATASTPAEAHIWRQVLQEAGIQGEVVGDYLNAGLGDIPGFRAELWVHRDDAEHALEVLRSATAKRTPGDENVEDMPESV